MLESVRDLLVGNSGVRMFDLDVLVPRDFDFRKNFERCLKAERFAFVEVQIGYARL